jgi:DNA-binding NtrC family response regulator
MNSRLDDVLLSLSERFARDVIASVRGLSLTELASVLGSSSHATSSKPSAAPPKIAATYAKLPTLAELEREYAEHVLRETHGNLTRACEILGIDRRTLYRKTAAWGLSRAAFRKGH